MAIIISADRGEIIEQPLSFETYERLQEPNILPVGASDAITLWESRVEVSRKIRKIKLADINELIDFYEGHQWHVGDDINVKSDKATVNLIFANIKKELPYLYFSNPTPIVNATRPEFEFSAFALQELLKSYTRYNLKTELKKHVRLCILDAKFAFGCLKVTYIPTFGDNPKKGEPVIAGYDELGFPIFVKDNENFMIEPDQRIISDLYYVGRCSPKEILIDPECRNFPERAKWIGHEIVRPLSYLKNNKLYKNTDKLLPNIEVSDIFQNTLNKNSEEVSASREFSADVDIKKVRFVEIYDLENGKLLVLPDNYHQFIREENIDMNPFSFLKFNESPDNFYPVPDVRIEKPLQQEVNVGRSMLVTHSRRAARKYYYCEDTFRGIDDAEGIEAAKDPEDMTMFKIADYDKPPMPLSVAIQDPAVYQNLVQSRMDYNEVTGSTEMQRGVTERRKTKGEAQYQESHSYVRRGDKQSLVADFIAETYTNLGELMKRTMTVEKAIQVIGASGIFWTEVKRTHIQGEFTYDIEVSDLRPKIPEIDREELSEFIFALSNFMNSIVANPVLMQIFDIQGLVKEFAKSYPSLDVEKILNMKITPEQIAQMLMMQMQGGQNAQQIA